MVILAPTVDYDEPRPELTKVSKTLEEGKPWCVGVMRPFIDMRCAEDDYGNVIGHATETEAVDSMMRMGLIAGCRVRKGRRMFHQDGTVLYVFHLPSYVAPTGVLQ